MSSQRMGMKIPRTSSQHKMNAREAGKMIVRKPSQQRMNARHTANRSAVGIQRKGSKAQMVRKASAAKMIKRSPGISRRSVGTRRTSRRSARRSTTNHAAMVIPGMKDMSPADRRRTLALAKTDGFVDRMQQEKEKKLRVRKRWAKCRKIGRIALMLKKVSIVSDEARKARVKARWDLVRKISRAAMAGKQY